jgi:hypothetical protein
VGRRHKNGATEHDVEGLLLHQHDGVHDSFASQLLVVGQGLRGEVALRLLPTLLIEAGSVRSIFDGFASACAFL